MLDYRPRLNAQPELLDELLADSRLYRRLFDGGSFEVLFTPFLVFGAIVHRTADELGEAVFVNEWTAPRKRLPVFDVDPLRELLEAPERRYFLAELLASFTKVASGTYWTKTRRGFRRKRFSELDPLHLIELATGAPSWQRPGLYRRLGDVALFLCGVFPDHTGRKTFSMSQAERLSRSVGLTPSELASSVDMSDLGVGSLSLLEQTGPRWYRIATEGATGLLGSGPTLLEDMAGQFRQARRVLNYVADEYLFRLDAGYLPGPN